ncbi:hypothetical protein AB6C62_09760 [Vibrio splendidus]|uniref:hypothetical protein n=1 Tax=Vibrio splendidus TaxID=29497 RepID=UPI000C85121B|nr:hypothetical protein [Vibrio splendidus]PMO14246.1 hypothetical protein BCT15_05380 [Vibrio splendidus]
MNNYTWVLASALGTLTLVGCTSKLTVKQYHSVNSDTVIQGTPYLLPQSKFDLTLLYTLESCELLLEKNGSEENSIPITFSTKATLTHSVQGNPKELFVIDTSDLSKPTKEYNLDVSYHPNGTVKTITTKATDLTGDIAVGVAKTIVSAAMPSTLSSVALSDLGEKALTDNKEKIKTVCTSETYDALTNKKPYKLALAKAENEVKIMRDKVVARRQLLLSSELDISKDKQLSDDIKQLRILYDDYVSAQRKYDATIKHLSIAQSHTFLGASSQVTTLKPDKLSVWSKHPEVRQALAEKMSTTLTVQTALKQSEPKKPGSTGSEPTVSEHDGFVFRVPTWTEVSVCQTSSCSHQQLLNKQLRLPDVGPLIKLPFTNKVGQDNTFTISFTEDSALEKVSMGSNAYAKAISEASLDVANVYRDFKIAEAKAKVLDKEQAATDTTAAQQKDLADLEHQLLLLTAQKKLAEASLGVMVDEELLQLRREVEIEKLRKEKASLTLTQYQSQVDQLILQQQVEDLIYSMSDTP